MKTSSVRAVGRVLWTMTGFVISVPAFGPPLAGFIALWAIAATGSGSFLPGLAAHRSDPAVQGVIVGAAIYGVYWLSATWMVAQFLMRRELSAVPLFLVTVIAASALIVLKPWHTAREPFALGPWALLHVAYMATIIWGSAERRSSRAQEGGLSEP